MTPPPYSSLYILLTTINSPFRYPLKTMILLKIIHPTPLRQEKNDWSPSILRRCNLGIICEEIEAYLQLKYHSTE